MPNSIPPTEPSTIKLDDTSDIAESAVPPSLTSDDLGQNSVGQNSVAQNAPAHDHEPIELTADSHTEEALTDDHDGPYAKLKAKVMAALKATSLFGQQAQDGTHLDASQVQKDVPTLLTVPLIDHARERKRRLREIIAAIVLLLLVFVVTWAQINVFGADSWLYLAFFNINLVLLVIVLFLVGRNVVKLVIERKRNVFGSKLRTRLVLLFLALTLIPTLIMFIASNRVVATSVDYWFKNQVEGSMEAALEVGQSFYTAAAKRLQNSSAAISHHVEPTLTMEKNEDAKDSIVPLSPTATEDLDQLLAGKQNEYGLAAIAIIDPSHNAFFWHESQVLRENWTVWPIWNEASKSINWHHVEEQHFGSMLWAGDNADYVITVSAIDGGKKGYLVVAENIGQGLTHKLEEINHGLKKYMALKNLKKPLKVSFTLILGVLSILVVFAATWLGFRLSRELTAPILALAEGTNRIAQGDLAFRLQDSATDEIGQLVASFNLMASDLEQNRVNLTSAHELLTHQNELMTARSAYIEAVLDTIAAGVISLDKHGRINTVNKAAGSILGIAPSSLKGQNPLTFLRGEYLAAMDHMVTSLQQRPESHWQRQIDINLNDKAWKLLVNAVALRGSDGATRGIVAIFEDITELERMQRMAAWREVARRIAHEIKNPLTPIKLSAQRLERKFGKQIEDPAFEQCTSLIVKQVEHLQQMVQEFSAFAKLPEVTPLRGDITPLLEELVGLFTNGHSHIHWELRILQTLPPILMDEEALHRALMNVMTNAVDAVTQHEHMLAEQAAQSASAENINDGDAPATQAPHDNIAPEPYYPSIIITALHESELALVRIVVADNGPGLSPEERSRMFEPYFTRKKGGTGLGLSIVRSVLNDHHGYARALSNPKGGTIVTMELPVA